MENKKHARSQGTITGSFGFPLTLVDLCRGLCPHIAMFLYWICIKELTRKYPVVHRGSSTFEKMKFQAFIVLICIWLVLVNCQDPKKDVEEIEPKTADAKKTVKRGIYGYGGYGYGGYGYGGYGFGGYYPYSFYGWPYSYGYGYNYPYYGSGFGHYGYW
ncbi:PREDICTED: uncharacterized protein F12A10.7-like [Nicrophorus vespilloides]|uniref:Uncharacterized protein F12A10.7-like n=1 Tax=Nicrophorus vespilloides TaxID=110193 RepID=A0ABM1NDD9_NICVS|nr:PREDICTED: uncharacterized protein F12A10.7-like [Nicrophorus vespilloides]